jgi:hypothetical protein
MQIGRITAASTPGVHRVSADVDGLPLWFESPDLSLRASPEAFGSALMVPALAKGERLEFADACDLQWRRNIDEIQPILRDWWGYGIRQPESPSGSEMPVPIAAGTGLCFSGGVDSFSSLLRSNEPIDHLLTVHGYDVPLGDHTRFALVEETTRRVATSVGARPVVIRTNLREHPAFKAGQWERTHGGALGGLGHLLADHVGRLVISSSIAYEHPEPWGSHWQIDPLWSSSRVQIVHFGAHHGRADKLRAIVHEPLVQQHLRVCWENRTAVGNCSRCEKCVRTRVVLASCGELGRFQGFEGAATLAADVDALVPGRTRGRIYRRLLEEDCLDAELEAAVRRYVGRLDAAHQAPSARRPVLERALTWARTRFR